MGFQNRELRGGYGKKLISQDLFTFWTNPLSWRVLKVLPRGVFDYMTISHLKKFLEPCEFQKWEIFNCDIKLLEIHGFKVAFEGVSNLKNHHLSTFVIITIDLQVVRPFRLLLRTTFVSKNISNTNNEAWGCVEKFFDALESHQVVLKNSLFELYLRDPKEKYYIWVSISQNHHLSVLMCIAIHLRVVRPFCLLLRTTYVSKNISNRNSKSWRWLEIFLEALEHHQVVFKSSFFDLFLRESSIFGYQIQTFTVEARLQA